MKVKIISYNLLFACFISCLSAQSSANFQLKRSTISSAGGQSASSSYSCLDVIGQPSPVGFGSSAQYGIGSGFLSKWKTEETGLLNAAPVPVVFELFQNYPNPFNPTTNIRFSLPTDTHVSLRVYDVRGREVVTLVEDDLQAGFHDVMLDAHMLSSGVYSYRLVTSDEVQIRKLLLLK